MGSGSRRSGRPVRFRAWHTPRHSVSPTIFEGVIDAARHGLRQVAGPARAAHPPERSARAVRSDRRHPLRGRLRRVVHGWRQQRGAADRHDEEHGVRARGERAASATPSRSACGWRGISSIATHASTACASTSPNTRGVASRPAIVSTATRSCGRARRRARRRSTPIASVMTVDAGVADLVILKSSHSAFAGFPRDEYTTLPDTQDRLLRDVADRHVALP